MDAKRATLHRNFRLLYITDFLSNADFVLPIYILFGRQYLHLNYFQAGSFFLASWFTSIALDFSGGNVADKIGRKPTFILGTALMALAIVPFLLTKSYPVLLLSSVLSGAGLALSSNAIEALIYEQAVSFGETAYYQHANATTQMMVFAGRVFASVLGGLAFKLDPRAPYLLNVIMLILTILVALAMRFSDSIDAKVQAHQQNYVEIMKSALHVYRQKADLIKFVIIGALLSVWSNMLFAYYQPFFIEHHVSSTALGVVFAAISIGSIFGAHTMRTLPDKLSAHAIQSVQLLGVISTSLLLETLHIPLAFVAPMILAYVSGFFYPNIRLFVNNNAPDAVRASVLSFASTMINLGSGIGLGCAYYFADRFDPTTILLTVVFGAACTLVLNFLLTGRRMITKKAET